MMLDAGFENESFTVTQVVQRYLRHFSFMFVAFSVVVLGSLTWELMFGNSLNHPVHRRNFDWLAFLSLSIVLIMSASMFTTSIVSGMESYKRSVYKSPSVPWKNWARRMTGVISVYRLRNLNKLMSSGRNPLSQN